VRRVSSRGQASRTKRAGETRGRRRCKSQGGTTAASLGVKIIRVASADETGYYLSPYYYDYGYSFAVPAPIPAPPRIMPPTEVEVTVTIRVTYIIE